MPEVNIDIMQIRLTKKCLVNFIINSNYAAAWFTLAVAMVVLGSALLICSEINRNTDRR